MSTPVILNLHQRAQAWTHWKQIRPWDLFLVVWVRLNKTESAIFMSWVHFLLSEDSLSSIHLNLQQQLLSAVCRL